MTAAVRGPGEGRLHAAGSMDDDHFDIDALLSRPRGTTRRRQGPLYKAPEFVKRLNSFEEVTAGQDVTFECQWKAFPKPDVRWFRDEEEITANPRYLVTEGDNGMLTLRIRKASKGDEGAYKCRAENQEGGSSTTGYLSVKGDKKDKVLSAQPRKHADHAVSYPPCLRTILEQQSLEEREEDDYEPIRPSTPVWPMDGLLDKPKSGSSCPPQTNFLKGFHLADRRYRDVDDDVAFQAPLADEEDDVSDEDGMSDASTEAEPELFILEDVSDAAALSSSPPSRAHLMVSDPPRFNTPQLRTPSPPGTPTRFESQILSPPVPEGPTLASPPMFIRSIGRTNDRMSADEATIRQPSSPVRIILDNNNDMPTATRNSGISTNKSFVRPKLIRQSGSIDSLPDAEHHTISENSKIHEIELPTLRIVENDSPAEQSEPNTPVVEDSCAEEVSSLSSAVLWRVPTNKDRSRSPSIDNVLCSLVNTSTEPPTTSRTSNPQPGVSDLDSSTVGPTGASVSRPHEDFPWCQYGLLSVGCSAWGVCFQVNPFVYITVVFVLAFLSFLVSYPSKR